MRAVKITDTTFRDAHQSLMATRMRTESMLPIAEKMDQVGFNSLEVWGGATFEIASSAYRETAWLFAFAMTIPLAIIVQQYVKSKKKKITQAT